MAFVVTAVVTAVEIGTVAAIATAVAEVGMAMSVVGAVTGNKTLTKYGGYLSLAGGVVSLGAAAVNALSGTAAAGASEVAGGVASSLGADATVGAGLTDAAKAYTVDLGVNGADKVISSAFNGGTAAAVSELSMLDPSGVGAQTAGINSGSNVSTASNLNGGGNIAGAPSAPSVASPVNEAASKTANAASTVGENYSANYSGQPMYGPNGTSNLASGLGSGSGTSSNWIKNWWNSLDSTTKNAALSATGKIAEGIFAGWSQEQRQEFEKEKWNLMQSNANAQPVMTFKKPGLINQRGV